MVLVSKSFLKTTDSSEIVPSEEDNSNTVHPEHSPPSIVPKHSTALREKPSRVCSDALEPCGSLSYRGTVDILGVRD